MSPRVALLRLAASLPSSAALMHGVGAVMVGVTLLVEPPGGYMIRVFDGPRAIMPLAVWGVLYLAAGIAVLALRGGPSCRAALVLLAGSWGAYGGGALWVGLRSDEAACLGGIAWLLLAASAMRAAFEFARWPRCASPECSRTTTSTGG